MNNLKWPLLPSLQNSFLMPVNENLDLNCIIRVNFGEKVACKTVRLLMKSLGSKDETFLYNFFHPIVQSRIMDEI